MDDPKRKTRARRRSGSVRRLGEERYEIQVDGKRGADGKRRRIKKVVHGSRKDAVERSAAMLDRIARSVAISGERITVNAAFERFIRDKELAEVEEERIELTTIEWYRRVFEHHIEPVLGYKRLRDLEKSDITNLLAEADARAERVRASR